MKFLYTLSIVAALPWPKNEAPFIGLPESFEDNEFKALQPALIVLDGIGCWQTAALDSGYHVAHQHWETHCRLTSPSNTYVRAGDHGGNYAIMYTMFFAHDKKAADLSWFDHSWQSVIVWKRDKNSPPYAVSFSDERGWQSYYVGTFIKPSNGQGGTADDQNAAGIAWKHAAPLVSWNRLTWLGHSALSKYVFGKTMKSQQPPFIDGTGQSTIFAENLAEAWISPDHSTH
ncbi:hypothetical protein MRB53_039151 [Persea americana]|nr:hypothetical protein MRB53_039151 [Persea americana]